MHPLDRLSAMENAFTQWRSRQCTLTEFVNMAHQQSELLKALPPAFGTVLNDLLNRLESSVLFDEESCSFSQQDLASSVELWLTKARHKLEH